MGVEKVAELDDFAAADVECYEACDDIILPGG